MVRNNYNSWAYFNLYNPRNSICSWRDKITYRSWISQIGFKFIKICDTSGQGWSLTFPGQYYAQVWSKISLLANSLKHRKFSCKSWPHLKGSSLVDRYHGFTVRIASWLEQQTILYISLAMQLRASLHYLCSFIEAQVATKLISLC